MRHASRGVIVVTLLCSPRASVAGGFDIPDNGVEALGRGGAFVAKADSPLALYYNIAGLARQRGTRVLLDTNLIYHDIAFTRAGGYPGDPTDARTPYAGQPYPAMHDGANWFPVPFLGLSSDFGYFQKLTIGFALYGPHAIGIHEYGTRADVPTNLLGKTTIAYQTTLPNGMTVPSPTRYDVTASTLLIILPTLGVGWSPWKYLDVGAAAQLVYANLDLMNANYTRLGPALCPPAAMGEYAGCDAYGRIRTNGITGRGIFSLLAHPTAWLDVGASYTMFANVHATGASNPSADGSYPKVNPSDPRSDYVGAADGLHAFPPSANYQSFNDAPVTLDTRLPDVVRLGARGVMRYPDGSERADLEINLVWENWSSLNQTVPPIDATVPPIVRGDPIHATDFQLGKAQELNVVIPHNYKDVVGVRIGGQYNYRVSDRSRLIGRLGFYYDSGASRLEDTHLDFNTADKFGFTVGAGYQLKGFTLNLGYAFVYSPDRTVTTSSIRAVSAINGSQYDATDPIIAYNKGHYHYATQIVSLGLTFNLSEWKRARPVAN